MARLISDEIKARRDEAVAAIRQIVLDDLELRYGDLDGQTNETGIWLPGSSAEDTAAALEWGDVLLAHASTVDVLPPGYAHDVTLGLLGQGLVRGGETHPDALSSAAEILVILDAYVQAEGGPDPFDFEDRRVIRAVVLGVEPDGTGYRQPSAVDVLNPVTVAVRVAVDAMNHVLTSPSGPVSELLGFAEKKAAEQGVELRSLDDLQDLSVSRDELDQAISDARVKLTRLGEDSIEFGDVEPFHDDIERVGEALATIGDRIAVNLDHGIPGGEVFGKAVADANAWATTGRFPALELPDGPEPPDDSDPGGPSGGAAVLEFPGRATNVVPIDRSDGGTVTALPSPGEREQPEPTPPTPLFPDDPGPGDEPEPDDPEPDDPPPAARAVGSVSACSPATTSSAGLTIVLGGGSAGESADGLPQPDDVDDKPAVPAPAPTPKEVAAPATAVPTDADLEYPEARPGTPGAPAAAPEPPSPPGPAEL
jgi:hypothetical protein